MNAKGRTLTHEVTLSRLTDVAPSDIAAQMSDPRVAEHMPLLTGVWDTEKATKFIKMREEYWARDGLGHWGFLVYGQYVGWGGFQKEGDQWDFGLVLRSQSFGLGR